jgi:hypothetical protein
LRGFDNDDVHRSTSSESLGPWFLWTGEMWLLYPWEAAASSAGDLAAKQLGDTRGGKTGALGILV